jgi:CRISPR-associated endonuclease/helicase Cas3
LAGRWHDLGKAHPAFQNSIRAVDARPDRQDLAKAPDAAWRRGRDLYPVSSLEGGRQRLECFGCDDAESVDRRVGFRHELASTLALFAVLSRHRPDHPALLGPWLELFRALGQAPPEAPSNEPPSSVELELLALDGPSFDLLAFLVCSHHGKVRATLHPSPADQERSMTQQELDPTIRGVADGDRLPSLPIATGGGELANIPSLTLHLGPAQMGLHRVTGTSWTDRVAGLLEAHGPFTLAYLEAILRASDQRASRLITPDGLLEERKR